MSSSIVLTDGAKFKCTHMIAPIGITEGVSISLTSSKVKVDGSKLILNGTSISGFTKEKGCIFQIPGGAFKPCDSFQLAAVPATGLLSENNQKVYIEADKSAISVVPSTGNAIPGLTIIESQTKLKA